MPQRIFAHRGASGYAPENTLEAFQLATEMGAHGVELDVHLTLDDELVVAPVSYTHLDVYKRQPLRSGWPPGWY